MTLYGPEGGLLRKTQGPIETKYDVSFVPYTA